VEVLAKHFYESNYNIEKLLRKIFSSDWFYDEDNMASKVKSPIELLTGLMKCFNMHLDNADALVNVEKILGQVLFFPPNVAGWPGGLNWIDSSSLMFRLRMAEFIFNHAEIDYQAKEDLGMEMGEVSMQIDPKKNKNNDNKKISLSADLNDFLDHFMQFAEDEMFGQLADYFFTAEKNVPDRKVIEKYARKSSNLEYLTSMTVLMLSTPQYQLC